MSSWPAFVWTRLVACLYLTDAGQGTAATCQGDLRELSRFEIAVADLKELKQGYLRLLGDHNSQNMLSHACGSILWLSRVDVSLKVTNHEHVLERLTDNQGWPLHSEPATVPDRNVSSHPFVKEPLVVLAPSSLSEEHSLKHLAEAICVCANQAQVRRLCKNYSMSTGSPSKLS